MLIQSVFDASFRPYGRVVEGLDMTELVDALAKTPTPENVVYVASSPELEATPQYKVFQDVLFGGMPVQLGYCNGHNNVLNAVEYHRDSEFNLPQTDMILLIGKQQDIDTSDFSYDTAKIEAFKVPAGTLIECYATTLHYAPCSVDGAPFRALVALARGTNEPLPRPRGTKGEDMLLTHVNKWLIGHKDSGMSANDAHLGLKGENITL